MELPIRIIIILFVAVVVGGMMIVFSKQVLLRAQTNLNDQNMQHIDEDRILKVDDLNEQAVEGLLTQCLRENLGVAFEVTDCFAIFSGAYTGLSSFPTGTALTNNFTVQNDVTGTPAAIRITFDPFGKIIIE